MGGGADGTLKLVRGKTINPYRQGRNLTIVEPPQGRVAASSDQSPNSSREELNISPEK